MSTTTRDAFEEVDHELRMLGMVAVSVSCDADRPASERATVMVEVDRTGRQWLGLDLGRLFPSRLTSVALGQQVTR